MQRVLIVDDDRLVADTLALIFGKSGFEAKAVYSADDALICARAFAPISCSATSPCPDATASTWSTTCRRELPSCHILVLTGFYSNLKNVREQAVKLRRPVGILTKPCQPTELLREAAALLATA